jgi:tetratricopeptide (TPR) repeat protein/DNA-binding transcriptional regulator YiaG
MNPEPTEQVQAPVDQASMAARIRALRIRNGMSQASLATTSGLSASYVSLIEAGRRVPKGKAVEQISRALRISPQELLGGKPADPLIVELELRHVREELESGNVRRALQHLDLMASRYAGTLSRDLELRMRVMHGVARYRLGDTRGGIAELDELLAESVPGDETTSLLQTLATCYLEIGDLARAIDLAQQGLNRLQAAEPVASEDFVALSVTLASAYRERGDLMSAEAAGRRALEFAEGRGSPRARGMAYRNASINADARGDRERAMALAARALGAFAEDDSRLQLARMRCTYARIMLRSGGAQAAEAERLLTDAEPVLKAAGSPAELAQCRLELARACLTIGHLDHAIEAAKRAVEDTTEASQLEGLRALMLVALAHHQSGAVKRAGQELRSAHQSLMLVPPSRSVAQAWRELGDVYARTGSASAAIAAYEQALSMAGIPPIISES